MRILFIYIIFISNLFSATTKTYGQFAVLSSRYSLFQPPEHLPVWGGGYIGIDKRDTRVKGSGWNVARYIISLSRYDDKLRKLNDTVLAGGEPVYSSFYAVLKKSNDSIWFIYIEPAKGSNIGNIKAVPINSTKLQAGNAKTLALGNQVNMSLKFFGSGDPTIYIESSPDTKNHCLFINTGGDEVFLAGFDENFTTLWSGRQKIPGYNGPDITSISINNMGETFITSIKKDNTSISIYNRQGKAEHKKLSFGSIHPTDIRIYNTKAKEGILISGMYAETENITGVFSAVINRKTYMVEKLINSDFPEIIIERLGKSFTKKGGIIPDYLSWQIFERNNGTLVQVLECKHRLGADGLSGTGIGGPITASFTDGGIVFSHIPRYVITRMTTTDNEYFATTCKDDFILFYKDHVSNLQKSLDERQTSLNGEKDGVLVAAHIGNDGKVNERVKVGSSGSNSTENIKMYMSNECLAR